MHVFGAFALDIIPGTPDSLASVRLALLRYTRARMAGSSSLRNVPPSRSRKGRSIPSKTNWTRSGNEPAEPSRPPRAHIIPSALLAGSRPIMSFIVRIGLRSYPLLLGA